MKSGFRKIKLSVPVLFIFFSGATSITSLSSFADIPSERQFFKALTLIFLIFATLYLAVYSRPVRTKDFLKAILFALLFAVLAVTDLINNSTLALIPILRLVGVFLVLLCLFSLKTSELEMLLKYFLAYGLLVSLISIVFFLTDFSRAEKFPIIGIYSNKSIIFEQNVFGIFIYLCVIIIVHSSVRKPIFSLHVVLFLFGVVMSFYRTVYGLTSIFLISRLNVVTKFLMTLFIGYLITYNFEVISGVLKLEQILTLTGRTDLWAIGLTGFSESPFWGMGESSIPEYSNKVLNRNPPFTTYHNVFVDVLYSAGTFGLIAMVIFVLAMFAMVPKANSKYLLLFLLAPSIFNTFYPFAPNILGLITGTWIVLEYRKSTNRTA